VDIPLIHLLRHLHPPPLTGPLNQQEPHPTKRQLTSRSPDGLPHQAQGQAGQCLLWVHCHDRHMLSL